MREGRIRGILSYLDGKAREGFTGGVRMGFEDGRPQSFAETKNPDKEIPETIPGFNIKKELETACTDKYYGTLFLVYESGQIIRFSTMRTYQGKVLDEMLGSMMQPKQRLAVTVRRSV